MARSLQVVSEWPEVPDVVAVVGLSLGGGLGALVTTAYIGADKSFRIEKLVDGTATPVIVASGFLTEGGDSWGPWQQIIQRRYPDSPVYRVHWGAKNLRRWGDWWAAASGKLAWDLQSRRLRQERAGPQPKSWDPLGPMLVPADLLKNAWHTAKVRADRTGVALAGLMARTDADSYILVGHSLGARAMVTAAQTSATNPEGPKVATAHLLGAAIGAKGDLAQPERRGHRRRLQLLLHQRQSAQIPLHRCAGRKCTGGSSGVRQQVSKD